MEWKAKADSEREGRRDRGRMLMDRARLLEEEDARAASAEALERLALEKERARKIKAERDLKEMLENEKHNETNERILMHKEELASIAFETALAEKLRIEQAKAAAAAEEARKKAAEERERERLAEEKRIAEEERAAAAAAEALRMKEVMMMKKNDFNILSIVVEPEIKEQENEEEEEEEEEEKVDDSEDVAVVELDTPLTRRMRFFLSRMKVAKERNLTHPRRDGKQFFVPLSFSEDISFDNFNSKCIDEEERLSTWKALDLGMQRKKKPDEGDPEADRKNAKDFSDVALAVKAHKQHLIQERLQQLYRTSNTDTKPGDMSEVFRVDSVDWKAFFLEQEALLYRKPETPAAVVDEEAAFAAEMRKLKLASYLKNVNPNSSSSSSSTSQNGLEGLPESLMPNDANLNALTPLPFGAVSRSIILPPMTYKHFQVSQCNASLTAYLYFYL